MKISHKCLQTKIGKVVQVNIVILIVLYSPVYQVWAQMDHDMDMDMATNIGNDRLMTNEVNMIKGPITKIKSSASTGSFDNIQSWLMIIEMNWMSVKTELQVRNENGSINRFEESLKSVEESLKTENKSTIIHETKGLSTAFDDVIKSLEKVDMNVSKFITNLSYSTLTWLLLTLVVAEVMKVGKIRL